MASVPIIGAGLLGHLKYREDTDRWALNLGHQLESLYFEVFSEDVDSVLMEDPPEKTSPKISETIDKILKQYGIHISVEAAQNDCYGLSSTGAAAEISRLIRNRVRKDKDANTFALVCIGQCVHDLQRKKGDGQRSHIAGHLRSIQKQVPGLKVNIAGLETVLLSLPNKEICDVVKVSETLEKLLDPLDVLLISCEPWKTESTKSGVEFRELTLAVNRSSNGSQTLKLHHATASQVSDLRQTFDNYQPHIVHFSCHGSDSGIFLQDKNENPQEVDKALLANFLGHYDIDLVFLNACYSGIQASAMVDAIGTVIGMDNSITNIEAQTFAREFYGALGQGNTFEMSFDLALSVLHMDSGRAKPRFLTKNAAGEYVSYSDGKYEALSLEEVVLGPQETGHASSSAHQVGYNETSDKYSSSDEDYSSDEGKTGKSQGNLSPMYADVD